MDVEERAGGQTSGGWLQAGDGGVDRPGVVGGHVGKRDHDIALRRAAALVDVHRVTAARGEADHLQLGADVLGLGIPAQRHRARRLVAELDDDRGTGHAGGEVVVDDCVELDPHAATQAATAAAVMNRVDIDL